MKKLSTLAFFWATTVCITVLTSCAGRNKPEQTSDTAENQHILTSSYEFLKDITESVPPILIDTSFDNFTDSDYLSSAQIELLNLRVLDEGPGTRFSVGGKINLSDTFQTYIINFLPNEHELFTALVNYDPDFLMIDFQIVAYDDIAEGFSRVYSNINPSIIEVTEVSFVHEESETILREVTVNAVGRFILK